MLNHNSPIPLYIQLAEVLKEQIIGGDIEGRLIGSEAELSRRWGVSRVTVRKALARLNAEGLTIAKQGKGTFVREQLIRQGLAKLETLDESIVRQGLETSMHILEFGSQKAPDYVARALGLAANEPVLAIRRRHMVKEEPIALVTVYVPEPYSRLITKEEAANKPVYRILPEKLGIEIGEGVQLIKAWNSTDEEARLLQVPPGTALLVCSRITTLTTGVPAMYATFLYRSDRFGFEIILPREHRTEITWAIPGLKIAHPEGHSLAG